MYYVNYFCIFYSWHSLPKIKDYVVPLLSSGACNIMLFIKEHLNLLEEKCYNDVFEKVWRHFCYAIDELLFDEVCVALVFIDFTCMTI